MVDKIHPDLATSGGILQTHRIGDMAFRYGVPMAMHFAGTPVSCMANVHCAAATRNFLALENHSLDVPFWQDLVTGTAPALWWGTWDIELQHKKAAGREARPIAPHPTGSKAELKHVGDEHDEKSPLDALDIEHNTARNAPIALVSAGMKSKVYMLVTEGIGIGGRS